MHIILDLPYIKFVTHCKFMIPSLEKPRDRKMKEADGRQMQSSSGGGSRSGMTTRSAVDKEKTKMRERHRRSITTKIFNGLRKHGGYRLSPRADINEVLRQLASEAGWIVEPDGTTYRSTSTSNAFNVCAACGAGMIRSGTPTPTSSFIGGVVGGECSTTASPRRVTGGDSMLPYTGPQSSLYYSGVSSGGGGGAIVSARGVSSSPHDPDNPRGVYTFGRLSTGGIQSSTTTVGGGVPSAVTLAAYQHQQFYLQEARASNQNTPVGSPQRHV